MKTYLRSQPGYKVGLLLLDIVVFALSLSIAIWQSFGHNPVIEKNLDAFLFFATVEGSFGLIVYLATFYFNNLYKRHIIVRQLRQVFLISKSLLITLALVLLFTVFFFHLELVTFGRFFFFVLFICCFSFSIISRIFVVTPLIKTAAIKNIGLRNLLLVGDNKKCSKVIELFINDPYNHFNIVGIVDEAMLLATEITCNRATERFSIKILGKIDDLAKIVKKNEINEILIAIDKIPYLSLVHLVEKCIKACPVVRIYSDFLQIVVNKMHVEQYSKISVIMLSQKGSTKATERIKRCIDICCSLAALIVLSPFFAGIALGIKLSSPGPVFYKQIRIGKDGKAFNFYKFRSMHVSNDNKDHKKFVQNFIKKGNASSNSNEIKVFKITDDPRIFKFGSFLRKTSLDEFPQFYNVLKGDMSLVGPRPCLPYEWECYDNWHKNRLNILPGCTGIWQALGRSSVSFEEMVILDLYYISNMSIWLDIRIILQTFPVIFLGKGGY